jgi:hypothetical protein
LADEVISLDTAVQGTDPFEDEEDVDAVEDAFGVFASALETVLYTMSAKALLFRLVPVIGLDIVRAVRDLETALNVSRSEYNFRDEAVL